MSYGIYSIEFACVLWRLAQSVLAPIDDANLPPNKHRLDIFPISLLYMFYHKPVTFH